MRKLHTDNQNFDFDDYDEIEIRLTCCWTVLTFWNICGGYLTQNFNSWTLRGDIYNNFESSWIILSHRNLTQKIYVARNFQKLIGKRLLGDIYWNPENIAFVKCYLVS